jgi:hypothetical protein
MKPPLLVKPCYEKAIDRMQKNNMMIVTGKCQGRIMKDDNDDDDDENNYFYFYLDVDSDDDEGC